MGELEQKNDELDELEWNVDTEVHLLFSMVGHKPVGINKYFQMACIWNKFTSSINKNVSSDAIWKRLETMYDLTTLDDAEVIPFPNEDQDFFLPEDEFSDLMREKLRSVMSLDANAETTKADEIVTTALLTGSEENEEPMKTVQPEIASDVETASIVNTEDGRPQTPIEKKTGKKEIATQPTAKKERKVSVTKKADEKKDSTKKEDAKKQEKVDGRKKENEKRDTPVRKTDVEKASKKLQLDEEKKTDEKKEPNTGKKDEKKDAIKEKGKKDKEETGKSKETGGKKDDSKTPSTTTPKEEKKKERKSESGKKPKDEKEEKTKKRESTAKRDSNADKKLEKRDSTSTPTADTMKKADKKDGDRKSDAGAKAPPEKKSDKKRESIQEKKTDAEAGKKEAGDVKKTDVGKPEKKPRKDKRWLDEKSDSDSSAGPTAKKERKERVAATGGESASEDSDRPLPMAAAKRQSLTKRPTRNTPEKTSTPAKRRRI